MFSEPNELLKAARDAARMTQAEVAERANAQVEAATSKPGAMDADYVGKLERGIHRWPNQDYRRALREVLHTASDADLGFFNPRSRTVTVVTKNSFVPNRKWKLQQIANIVTPEALTALCEALRCDLSQDDLTRHIDALEQFCNATGLAHYGPAAEAARSDYQATIQLRPSPTWRDIEGFGTYPHDHMPPSVPAPRTLDQRYRTSRRNPT